MKKRNYRPKCKNQNYKISKRKCRKKNLCDLGLGYKDFLDMTPKV